MKQTKTKHDKDTILERLYSIGEASEKLNLSSPTLRMYEHHGVLIPYKTKSGRRYYSDADLERVKCMRHMIKDIGLNLEGMRRLFALLPCWQIKSCIKKNREKCPVYLDSSRPCWTFKHVTCRKKPIDCKTCEIYLMSSTCTDRLKTILKGIGYLKPERG
jgi:MerR family transcriptional regulator/heat shock protein HspR